MFRFHIFVLLFMATLSPQLYANETLQELAQRFFSPLPESMPGSEQTRAEQVKLGERLYFETALSINHTQSCNSCHNIKNGKLGVDHLVKSPGALGQLGQRNTPTTFNAGFQFAQFWDGRAKNLVEQAKSPLLNPIEMALDSESQAVKRLEEKGYLTHFQLAFPNQAAPLTFNNISYALAAFEMTLITHDRFDDYLKGDDQALSQQEKKGMVQFVQNGCIGCHSGALLGGQMLQKLGVVNPYPHPEDKGLAQVTGNPADNFMFKVPSLRGVGQTGPYFHDGATRDLEEVVRNTGWHQMGILLSNEEVENIAAFLKALDNTKAYNFTPSTSAPTP